MGIPEEMKVCPNCRSIDGIVLEECGYGRIGERGFFESGDFYAVFLRCNKCGATITVQGVVAIARPPPSKE